MKEGGNCRELRSFGGKENSRIIKLEEFNYEEKQKVDHANSHSSNSNFMFIFSTSACGQENCQCQESNIELQDNYLEKRETGNIKGYCDTKESEEANYMEVGEYKGRHS